MAEFTIFVDNLRFSYEGPFQANELLRTIGNYLYDKGYDKKPVKEFEHRMPHGTYIEWQLSNWKKVSDYLRNEINLRVIISEMKKVDAVINGEKCIVENGKVLIIINGYIETDYASRWDERPFFQLIRVLYDKYFYKEYQKRYEYLFADHINQLYALLQRFFNVYSSHGLKTLPTSVSLHD